MILAGLTIEQPTSSVTLGHYNTYTHGLAKYCNVTVAIHTLLRPLCSMFCVLLPSAAFGDLDGEEKSDAESENGEGEEASHLSHLTVSEARGRRA